MTIIGKLWRRLFNQPQSVADADLGFLCDRAQNLLEQQISSFDQIRQNSGILLTVLTVFLPFFLNGIEDSVFWIQLVTLLPTILIIVAILIFLSVFGTKPLDRGIGLSRYQELADSSHEQVLLIILGGIRSSFTDNKQTLLPVTKRYGFALFVTKIAVVLSASVLIANKFVRPPEKITQVHITNPLYYVKPKATRNTQYSRKGPGEHTKRQSPASYQPASATKEIINLLMSNQPQKPRLIPQIPPKDRERIEKGEPGRPLISPPVRPAK